MFASDRCNPTCFAPRPTRGIVALFGTLLRRQQSLQAFEAFRGLSDYQLRDLGVLRGDILGAQGGAVVRQCHDFA